MKAIIIDNGSSYLSKLLALAQNYSPAVVEIVKLDKAIIGADDLVILSGGHKHAVLYDLKYFDQELKLIKNSCRADIRYLLGSGTACLWLRRQTEAATDA